MSIYSKIENLNEEGMDRLEEYIKNEVCYDYYDNYVSLVMKQSGYEDLKDFLLHFVSTVYGCSSGILSGVNGFIYNDDVDEFVEKNNEAINDWFKEYEIPSFVRDDAPVTDMISEVFGYVINRNFTQDYFMDDILLDNGREFKRHLGFYFAESICHRLGDLCEMFFMHEYEEDCEEDYEEIEE